MTEKTFEISKPEGEQGFSLIEIMIGLVIFLVVMAAIFGVFRIGLITRNSLNNRSETVGNARTAVNAVGREAVNAGLGYSRVGSIVPDDFANDLLGIPKDPGNERDMFTGVMAGDEVNESDLSLSGQKNDVISFIYRDLNFNGGEPIVISDASISGNNVVLDTGVDGCVSCKKYDVFLVEAADGSQALAIATNITSNRYVTLATNDPLNLNVSTSGNVESRSILTKCQVGETSHCFDYNPHATAKRVFLTSYSVNGAGTLVRTIYGNNTGAAGPQQIQTQPLSYGVQRFQVRYLMQDGTMSNDPSQGNTLQSKMNEVVQVEIKITIRVEGNEQGTTNSEIINLTSTFSTRNLRYSVE